MSEELAWAAGFFDGEGCTSVANRARDGHHVVRASLGQNGDPPVLLQRFRDAVGVGQLYGPYVRKATGATFYTWVATRTTDAQLALRRLWPWLGEPKRDQAARRFAGFYLQDPPMRHSERWRGLPR